MTAATPPGATPTHTTPTQITATQTTPPQTTGPQTTGATTGAAPRRARLERTDPAGAAVVDRMVRLALDGLPAMQNPDGGYCHTRNFTVAAPGGARAGHSLRYTAIVLLGARHLPAETQRAVLGGRSAGEVCGLLLDGLDGTDSVGHADAERALRRLDALDRPGQPRYVVDLAWAVSALVQARGLADVEDRLTAARGRLLGSRPAGGVLFPHVTGSGLQPAYRSHLTCFADQVYPVQALARLHASASDPAALAAADACAARICALQGEAGQWWWHYDARTGEVVEGYPVYSVHQHAMAPMALLDLAEAGGQGHADAIGRGLVWMTERPEYAGPMIHDGHGVTTRKVARHDPKKLVRGLRGATTGLRPGWRLGALDRLFPPAAVDTECRPYEFGWLLDCWLGALPGPQRGHRRAEG